MNLVEVSGPQTSSDPLWNGATVMYWGPPTWTIPPAGANDIEPGAPVGGAGAEPS